MSVGKRIKEVRRSLTKSDFAKEFGVTPDYIRMLESDEKTPGSTLVELICLKYNINKNYLLTGEGSQSREEKKSVMEAEESTKVESEQFFNEEAETTILLEKAKFAYQKGGRDIKAWVRGTIEEAWNEVIKKETQKKEEKEELIELRKAG